MRDPARAADQSDPARNFQFSRGWRPPEKRKRQGVQTPAPSETSAISSDTQYAIAEGASQRAVSFAMRRAATIDRTADLLLSVGRFEQAERLSLRAAEIRAVAA